MNNLLKQELETIYKRYGFEVAKTYEQDQVLVFTLKTGYFDNADIVPLSIDANTDKAFNDFSALGYACTKREYLSSRQAEHQLFKGFFSVTSILERLKKDYEKFTNNIVKAFSDDAKYEYINAPYFLNGKKGEHTPAHEVTSRLKDQKPILFLIEAAAGFGKTCTAYEIVRLLTENSDYLPLFSELSRNRKAPIFRYVLLDEIDLKFPTLSSRLVQTEMVNGRVITILDGFDELLRKADDTDDFQNQEPMLETIGQFLKGSAKIVLTTRRTVLFEGDAFHTWAATHADDFELVRIRIGEPSVEHWLPEPRLQALKESDFDIHSLANPVLLSYLRCIPKEKFDTVVGVPQELVERYFNFMLERERTRQDLQMNPDTQRTILTTIAEDMIKGGYTSDQRENIVDFIMKSCLKLLEDALLLYPTGDRPDKEFLANKIASHALLDRSNQDENKIGFINEFVLGYFVAKNIMNSTEWWNDDLRFLEPAVISYLPRPIDEKAKLLGKIEQSLEFTPISDRIDLTTKLCASIPFVLENDEAEGLELIGLTIGKNSIKNFQFNDCIFKSCKFQLDALNNVNFLNCRFYDQNEALGMPGGPIYLLGDIGDSDFLKEAIKNKSVDKPTADTNENANIETFVLEKFWPVGREKITHKHRPISGICSGSHDYRPDDIYEAIVRLKKKGILLQPNINSFVEINFDRFAEIKSALGR